MSPGTTLILRGFGGLILLPLQGWGEPMSLATAIDTAALEIVEALKSQGVNAAVDPAAVELPAVIINPDRIRFTRLSGRVLDVTWGIYFVALNNGEEIKDLMNMVEAVRQLWPIGEIEAATITLPSQSPDPLPMFNAELPTEIELED